MYKVLFPGNGRRAAEDTPTAVILLIRSTAEGAAIQSRGLLWLTAEQEEPEAAADLPQPGSEALAAAAEAAEAVPPDTIVGMIQTAGLYTAFQAAAEAAQETKPVGLDCILKTPKPPVNAIK